MSVRIRSSTYFSRGPPRRHDSPRALCRLYRPGVNILHYTPKNIHRISLSYSYFYLSPPYLSLSYISLYPRYNVKISMVHDSRLAPLSGLRTPPLHRAEDRRLELYPGEDRHPRPARAPRAGRAPARRHAPERRAPRAQRAPARGRAGVRGGVSAKA